MSATPGPTAKKITPPTASEESPLIDATLLSKGFQDSNYQTGNYQQFLTFQIKFSNQFGRHIRTFDGTLTFTDLLDNPILSASVAVNDPIAAGADLIWSGGIDYNQFFDSHRRLRAENKANLKIQFSVKKVLFADGTTKTH